MDDPTDQAMDQLFDLAVVLGEAMNATLAEHRLTPARAEILWLLDQAGPRTQRELSQTRGCTPRNVTGLVDALQEAGFVERAAHPRDRRAVMVQLTASGRSLLAGWRAERNRGAAQLFHDIPAGDIAVFAAVLGRVVSRLRAAVGT